MKYETPEMTALTPAIKAIQGGLDTNKGNTSGPDSFSKESMGAYTDWE
jgi:hypothetical protein